MAQQIYIFNTDMAKTVAKSDSMALFCDINVDLTGWKIRCEVYDESGSSIKIATVNSGGTSGDIDIDNYADGFFTINVAKDLTTDFDDTGFIEIEMENSSGDTYTVYQAQFNLTDKKITWTDPSV